METQLASASEKQVWKSEYFSEYVRRSGFKQYMGKSYDSIFVTKYELQEESGKTINIPLLTKLRSAGVRGSGVLSGKEEQLGNYNCAISIDWLRNGVVVPKSTSYKTEIDLLNAARPALRNWSADTLRKEMIYYLAGPTVAGTGSIPSSDVVDVDGNITVTGATDGNYNTWATANSDRILAGSATSNYSADHSAMLGNVDSTDDKMSASVGSLAKRIARSASPAIKPYMIEDGSEWFVMFHGLRAFRDLKNDSIIAQANREARARDWKSNPLFTDGDLVYDGVIHKEIPEIDEHVTTSNALFATTGAGGIPVAPSFLCGMGALGIAWGQEPTPRTKRDDDYQFRPGVGLDELRGLAKLHFPTASAAASKQHGVVTVYVAGVGD